MSGGRNIVRSDVVRRVAGGWHALARLVAMTTRTTMLLLTLSLTTVAPGTIEPARALGPGDLDPSFGAGGLSVTSVATNDLASSAALQADGKIVVAGQADDVVVIARYDATGARDATFGVAGIARDVVPWPIGFVAVDANGRIVVLRQDGFDVARLLPDGVLDATFGTNGIASTSFSSQALPAALALQPDGRIVAVANVIVTRGAFVLARYLPDGTPDATFGLAGIVVTDFDGADGAASAVAITADRKIVVTGSLDGTRLDGMVVRYLPDGRLDKTFGTAGMRRLPYEPLSAIVVQPDGKIVVGGDAFTLSRLELDGSSDPSFGNRGLALIPLTQGRLVGLALAPEGGLLAGGLSRRADGAMPFTLARYRPDGTRDVGFGDDGIVTTFIGSSPVTDRDDVRALLVQDDGKAILVGTAPVVEFSGTFHVAKDFALVRYLGGPLLTTSTTTSTTLPPACARDFTVRPRASRRAIVSALRTLRLAERSARRAGRRVPLSPVCAGSVDGAFVDAIVRVSGLLR